MLRKDKWLSINNKTSDNEQVRIIKKSSQLATFFIKLKMCFFFCFLEFEIFQNQLEDN